MKVWVDLIPQQTQAVQGIKNTMFRIWSWYVKTAKSDRVYKLLYIQTNIQTQNAVSLKSKLRTPLAPLMSMRQVQVKYNE